MKKLLSILLVALMLFVVSCDGSNPEPGSTPNTPSTSTETPSGQAGEIKDPEKDPAFNLAIGVLTGVINADATEEGKTSLSGTVKSGNSEIVKVAIEVAETTSTTDSMDMSLTLEIVSVPSSVGDALKEQSLTPILKAGDKFTSDGEGFYYNDTLITIPETTGSEEPTEEQIAEMQRLMQMLNELLLMVAEFDTFDASLNYSGTAKVSNGTTAVFDVPFALAGKLGIAFSEPKNVTIGGEGGSTVTIPSKLTVKGGLAIDVRPPASLGATKVRISTNLADGIVIDSFDQIITEMMNSSTTDTPADSTTGSSDTQVTVNGDELMASLMPKLMEQLPDVYIEIEGASGNLASVNGTWFVASETLIALFESMNESNQPAA